MQLQNSYQRVPGLFEPCQPIPPSAPKLFLWNSELASKLHLPFKVAQNREEISRLFSGATTLPGWNSGALAYAGHQFGHFVPQLGDGRAHLLGEWKDPQGNSWDIQLKGSGQTRFSRGGDGRCGLGPAVREYLMSEAMHALGVPTTRTLAVVTTGEPVYRTDRSPGAVVSRVASSHLRVGTFEYFAARGELESIRALADYTIERHFADGIDRDEPYSELVRRVMERQINLVVSWMRVGFIHGVMNTDNTALSGETIDYGPCAMMNVFDRKTVFSSIDHRGRYAYGNQPTMIHWNLTRFAEALLPVIDADQEQAISKAQTILNEFPSQFESAWLTMMGQKLGIDELGREDSSLIKELLARLEKGKLDYTNTFWQLTRRGAGEPLPSRLESELGDWLPRWEKRLQNEKCPETVMAQSNPAVIPRNHHVEKFLSECVDQGQTAGLESFLCVLRSPYKLTDQTPLYQDPPKDGDENYQTFCGT